MMEGSNCLYPPSTAELSLMSKHKLPISFHCVMLAIHKSGGKGGGW